MVASRFVIGAGSQMALVITDAFAARWFKAKEIGFMFALIGVSCRLGGVGGLYLGSVFFDLLDFVRDKNERLGWTLFLSFGLLLLCTFSTFLLVYLDRKGEKALSRTTQERKVKLDCKWLKEFGIHFWLILAMFVSFYATIFSFVATSQLFFVHKFNLSVKQANTASIVSYIVPMLVPMVGILMDWTGCYISWGLFGGFGIIFGAHVLFGFSDGYFLIPFIGNVFIGIAYICFNTAMKAVPTFLVDENHLVTAYGVLESFQSIGYAVVDVVVGVIIDNFGYLAQEIFLLCYLMIGIFPGAVLVFFLQTRANEIKSRCSYKPNDSTD